MPDTPQFTPREIYDWYTAGLDLLPDGSNPVALPTPTTTETFAEYRTRVTDSAILNCGDGLFVFLLFELSGADGTISAAVQLLDVAIRNMMQVRIKLLKLQPNCPPCP